MSYVAVRLLGGTRLDFKPVSSSSSGPGYATVNTITYNGTSYTAGNSLSTAPNILNGPSTTSNVNYNVYAFGSTSYSYTINYTSSGNSTIYLLAVGGGGGGGMFGGGGGGAGGVVMMPVTLPSGTSTITVTVGNGGAAGTTNGPGSNGGNTTVTINSSGTTIIAGGGGSGNAVSTPSYTLYGSGGGGGGGAGNAGGNTNANKSEPGVTVYANNGGAAGSSMSGGGGGAGTAGTAGNSIGIGGDGIQCTLNGISTFNPSGTVYGNYYWGGGGGGSNNGGVGNGNGGKGGGGGGASQGSANGTGGTNGINNGNNGAASDGAGGAGGVNTGGGGGGGWDGQGGAGGSGIVIIAFPQQVITASSSILYLNNNLTASAVSSMRMLYSFKQCMSTYNGPVIRVRRASDGLYSDFYADTTGNIGTGSNGTGTSLATWLTSTTGYLSTWYDQSGLVNNLVQTNTSLQPPIILNDAGGICINCNINPGSSVSQLQSVSNVFTASPVSNAHVILYSKSNSYVNNVLFSLNSPNTFVSRFMGHVPWSDGTYYLDCPNRSNSTASLIAAGTKTCFSAYKQSSTTTSGFNVNGNAYSVASNDAATVAYAGLNWSDNTFTPNHYIYSFVVFSQSLYNTADETKLKTWF